MPETFTLSGIHIWKTSFDVISHIIHSIGIVVATFLDITGKSLSILQIDLCINIFQTIFSIYILNRVSIKSVIILRFVIMSESVFSATYQ